MIGSRTTQAIGRCRGHTLVEMLTVLSISGIVLGVGVIRFGTSSVFMAKAERVAYRLVADLRLARNQAITDNKNHYLDFVKSAENLVQYDILRVESGQSVPIESTRYIDDDVALTGANKTAVFLPDGSAVKDYTYTITYSGGSYTVRVILATGAVGISGP